jgi:hypothetical protein
VSSLANQEEGRDESLVPRSDSRREKERELRWCEQLGEMQNWEEEDETCLDSQSVVAR